MNIKHIISQYVFHHARTYLAVVLPLLFLPAYASAATTVELHSHEQIRTSIKAYVQQRAGQHEDTEIQVDRLDERLRLAKCSIETEHYLPPGGKLDGRFVVGTRCNGDKRWAIFVPVKRTRFSKVAIVTTPVQRGERLRPEHIEMRRKALNSLHSGYILDVNKVLGKTTKYPLVAGSVLHSGNIKAAISVRRGDKVNILAKKGPIHVKMTGFALMDGATGQKIRVKNQLTKRIVVGTITYDGNVKVGL